MAANGICSACFLRKRGAAGDKLPQSKPDGFDSSLGEGASGETGDFAIQPATLPSCQRPHLRGGWLRPTGADWGSFSRHPLSHGMRRASSPKGTPLAMPQSLPSPPKAVPLGKVDCREAARRKG